MGTNKAEEIKSVLTNDFGYDFESEFFTDEIKTLVDEVIEVTNNSSQSEIDELTKEVERLRKENNSMLKEKMYFNRMKELVSKVAYDSEHYTQKTYEVLRNDAIGLLNEYNLTTH